ILQTIVPQVFNRGIDEVESSLDKKGVAVRNPFTTSLYIIALSKALLADGVKANFIIKPDEKISLAFNLIANYFTPLEDLCILHPFIQFHIARAIKLTHPNLGAVDQTLADQMVSIIV